MVGISTGTTITIIGGSNRAKYGCGAWKPNWPVVIRLARFWPIKSAIKTNWNSSGKLGEMRHMIHEGSLINMYSTAIIKINI